MKSGPTDVICCYVTKRVHSIFCHQMLFTKYIYQNIFGKMLHVIFLHIIPSMVGNLEKVQKVTNRSVYRVRKVSWSRAALEWQIFYWIIKRKYTGSSLEIWADICPWTISVPRSFIVFLELCSRKTIRFSE